VDEQEQKRLRADAEDLRAYARKLHEKARLLRKQAQRIAEEWDALLADAKAQHGPDNVSRRGP
jgi:uncharacterized coiled-coil DUF342 family protein